jgi:hypothetical protein
MGALLSLPLLAVPSMGTVSLVASLDRPLFRSPDPSSSLLIPYTNSLSPSEAHAVELRLALLSAAHVESSKTGSFCIY